MPLVDITKEDYEIFQRWWREIYQMDCHEWEDIALVKKLNIAFQPQHLGSATSDKPAGKDVK